MYRSQQHIVPRLPCHAGQSLLASQPIQSHIRTLPALLWTYLQPETRQRLLANFIGVQYFAAGFQNSPTVSDLKTHLTGFGNILIRPLQTGHQDLLRRLRSGVYPVRYDLAFVFNFA